MHLQSIKKNMHFHKIRIKTTIDATPQWFVHYALLNTTLLYQQKTSNTNSLRSDLTQTVNCKGTDRKSHLVLL